MRQKTPRAKNSLNGSSLASSPEVVILEGVVGGFSLGGI